MTKKVLNIIIGILVAIIIVYLSIKIALWGLEIEQADDKYNNSLNNKTAVTYVLRNN